MSILEIIKKIEENNRQQKLNEDEIKNLRDELTRRETKRNILSIENQNLKRQQIKVEIADVVKQLKKEWKAETVNVSVDPITLYDSRYFSPDEALIEMCNRAIGTYLAFNFKSNDGKSAKIARPFNPDAIEKTGRKLRDFVQVEFLGKKGERNYYQLKVKQEEIKNYIFDGSIASFSAGDAVVVIEAGLNREIDEENERE